MLYCDGSQLEVYIETGILRCPTKKAAADWHKKLAEHEEPHSLMCGGLLDGPGCMCGTAWYIYHDCLFVFVKGFIVVRYLNDLFMFSEVEPDTFRIFMNRWKQTTRLAGGFGQFLDLSYYDKFCCLSYKLLETPLTPFKKTRLKWWTSDEHPW